MACITAMEKNDASMVADCLMELSSTLSLIKEKFLTYAGELNHAWYPFNRKDVSRSIDVIYIDKMSFYVSQHHRVDRKAILYKAALIPYDFVSPFN